MCLTHAETDVFLQKELAGSMTYVYLQVYHEQSLSEAQLRISIDEGLTRKEVRV